MVHIYFYSNTSTCRQGRSIEMDIKKLDLSNSIRCVLSHNRQVINTIIGCPPANDDDKDVYFSVIVDKDDDDYWFDLFADAVVCLLRYSLSVYVPPFEDPDVIIG